MTTQERLYTATELLMLSSQTTRYELLEGHLIDMSSTSKQHGLITNWLAHLITGFVIEHKLGYVYGAETGFKLSTDPDTVLGIDIAYVAKENAQSGEGYFDGAPDLAVEVISPGNRSAEIHTKVTRYFQTGARLVWVLYPQSRVIYVYETPTDITVLEKDATLDGSNVLPGFAVKVADVFSILDR